MAPYPGELFFICYYTLRASKGLINTPLNSELLVIFPVRFELASLYNP